MKHSDETIAVQDVVVRVAALLDTVFADLSEAQQVVSVCISNPGKAQEGDVQGLQKLDVATQTVQAASGILKDLAAHTQLNAAGKITLKELYGSAALGHVVQVLRNGAARSETEAAGDVELF
ncbi:hypothetical protein [Acetobacter orientalis]|uniref:Uncharacterized protein n=1 Tax=Acetobacter orientalis TaxID=146474 RepID=A0A252A6R0_9PROT|nr:hypothetical protein [Acetobacter orientalis]OUI85276.1 hypothetical protein HK12_06270 [Acetobacter orientalis]